MDLGECLLALNDTSDVSRSHPEGSRRGLNAGVRSGVRSGAAPSLPAKPLPEWIDLIPAGVFNGRDGRGPYRNENPAQVITATRGLGLTAGLPIDFDHAIDLGAPHGQPAPAAGWIKELRLVNGRIQGRVEWTAAGAKALAAKLYRYISPVFEFAGDGTVQRLLRAAVTNNPNLYLTAIAAAGATRATDEHCRRTIDQLEASAVAPSVANLRAARSSLARVISHAAERFLSAGEIELCHHQGVDAARYALGKRERMTGRPLLMAKRSEARAAEAADMLKMSAADSLKKATEEIALFLKDPEHLEALQHLINADARVSLAIKQSAAPQLK